ncbi:UNVERIFIED_ORG: hypothetical protein LHK14_01160 [Roseateles sp. XES5]|nr:hypothetical protein [Roseateles sp. XES5]
MTDQTTKDGEIADVEPLTKPEGDDQPPRQQTPGRLIDPRTWSRDTVAIVYASLYFASGIAAFAWAIISVVENTLLRVLTIIVVPLLIFGYVHFLAPSPKKPPPQK